MDPWCGGECSEGVTQVVLIVLRHGPTPIPAHTDGCCSLAQPGLRPDLALMTWQVLQPSLVCVTPILALRLVDPHNCWQVLQPARPDQPLALAVVLPSGSCRAQRSFLRCQTCPQPLPCQYILGCPARGRSPLACVAHFPRLRHRLPQAVRSSPVCGVGCHILAYRVRCHALPS